ncbi:MAG TPA: hypothetical protein VKS24_01055 [Bradyrhizobium sp.]|nr:hypothetical protein [Bradyrhizobium sp.]
MTFWNRFSNSRGVFGCFCVLIALIVAGPASSRANAEEGFQGPSFRKGLWHFVRTLDVVRNASKNIKYRLHAREMTRCVDPTLAMKATFGPAPIGTCVSDKPEKVGNQYIFAHRCDVMGAVSTVITVNGEEAYTEVNEVSTGEHPRVDSVIAHRIGECQDDAQNPGRASVSSIVQGD